MAQLVKTFQSVYKIFILSADLLLILSSYVILFLFKFDGQLPARNFTPFLNAIPYISIAAIVYLDFFKVLTFYRKGAYDVLKSIAAVVFLLGITTIAVTYMLQGFSFPRTVLILTPIVQFVLLGSFNLGLLYFRRHLLGERNVMVVCTGQDRNVLTQKIEKFLKNDKIGKKLVLDISQEKIIMRRLKDMDEIFLSADIPAEFKIEIIKQCMSGKQVIYVVPQLFEISLINSKLMQLDDTPAFMVDKLGLTAEQAFVKRVVDVVLSILGIVILSPLMLVVAILVKMTSKGPAFYRQERMTQNNKTFSLIKFRTMSEDAENSTGPVLSEENDNRVTRVGRVLRRTRIDELPQFFNVLKGDMSLVGPRPERPFFVEQFIHNLPEYEYRFSVKAGITGYAQIFGKYSTSPEDKLRYDLMYIRNYSLFLDIKLIMQTIKVLFTPGSAYKKDQPSENTKKASLKRPKVNERAI